MSLQDDIFDVRAVTDGTDAEKSFGEIIKYLNEIEGREEAFRKMYNILRNAIDIKLTDNEVELINKFDPYSKYRS